jgi:hypothetical protein
MKEVASDESLGAHATGYPLYAVVEVPDLYLDALVQNPAGDLLFASVIGRDAVVRQFLAQLQLGVRDGGLSAFSLTSQAIGRAIERRVWVKEPDALKSLSGRVRTVFGELAHVFLYDAAVQQIDNANLSAWLLYPKSAQALLPDDRVLIDQRWWGLVTQLAPTVVLDAWRAGLVKGLDQLSQYSPIGNVSAWQVQLPTEWNQIISRLIRGGTLPVANALAETV